MSMRLDKYVCFYIRISLDYVAVLAAAFLAIWIRSLCFNSFVVLSKLEIFSSSSYDFYLSSVY